MKMKKELASKYDHKSVEKGKYQHWLEKEYFKAGDVSKKPYAIVIPPPNVTGKLHLGHAPWLPSLFSFIPFQQTGLSIKQRRTTPPNHCNSDRKSVV